MTAGPAVSARSAGWICGAGGCDSFGTFLRCDTCGWTATVPPPDDQDNGGQLTLDLTPVPAHTELDCARYLREHPRVTPRREGRVRAQGRAARAYAAIHDRHAPARLTRQPGTGVLTCPRCGYQP